MQFQISTPFKYITTNHKILTTINQIIDLLEKYEIQYILLHKPYIEFTIPKQRFFVPSPASLYFLQVVFQLFDYTLSTDDHELTTIENTTNYD